MLFQKYFVMLHLLVDSTIVLLTQNYKFIGRYGTTLGKNS